MKCDICGEEFESVLQLEAHSGGHKVRPVQESPLVVLLVLPDGCTPGKWQAATAFAEAVQELRGRYPGVRFQYVPFSYVDGKFDPALRAMLAIADE